MKRKQIRDQLYSQLWSQLVKPVPIRSGNDIYSGLSQYLNKFLYAQLISMLLAEFRGEE